YNWIPLFHISDSYSLAYKWLNFLKEKDIAETLGFVIMPNHVHLIIELLSHEESNLNKIISNGKRFMAYEIIKRLKAINSTEILSKLRNSRSVNDISKGQLHKVFEASFDAKPIFSDSFYQQKLDYIHHNPVSGKWNLCTDFVNYPHSSAAFYELGIPHEHLQIKDFREAL
ncbi:hypothetical protein GS399_09365, partial [Pedobacter sp. HMF7647]